MLLLTAISCRAICSSPETSSIETLARFAEWFKNGLLLSYKVTKLQPCKHITLKAPTGILAVSTSQTVFLSSRISN